MTLKKQLEKYIEDQFAEQGYEINNEEDVASFLDDLNGRRIEGFLPLFDWFGNAQDIVNGSIEATYYSDAIGHTIVLKHSVFGGFKALKNLVEFLMELNNDAVKLEKRLRHATQN